MEKQTLKSAINRYVAHPAHWAAYPLRVAFAYAAFYVDKKILRPTFNSLAERSSYWDADIRIVEARMQRRAEAYPELRLNLPWKRRR